MYSWYYFVILLGVLNLVNGLPPMNCVVNENRVFADNLDHVVYWEPGVTYWTTVKLNDTKSKLELVNNYDSTMMVLKSGVPLNEAGYDWDTKGNYTNSPILSQSSATINNQPLNEFSYVGGSGGAVRYQDTMLWFGRFTSSDSDFEGALLFDPTGFHTIQVYNVTNGFHFDNGFWLLSNDNPTCQSGNDPIQLRLPSNVKLNVVCSKQPGSYTTSNLSNGTIYGLRTEDTKLYYLDSYQISNSSWTNYTLPIPPFPGCIVTDPATDSPQFVTISPPVAAPLLNLVNPPNPNASPFTPARLASLIVALALFVTFAIIFAIFLIQRYKESQLRKSRDDPDLNQPLRAPTSPEQLNDAVPTTFIGDRVQDRTQERNRVRDSYHSAWDTSL